MPITAIHKDRQAQPSEDKIRPNHSPLSGVRSPISAFPKAQPPHPPPARDLVRPKNPRQVQLRTLLPSERTRNVAGKCL